jgi:HlyD family secretion protein
LNKSQSDLDHAKVMLTDAQQKYTRAKELSAKQLLPQSDLDAAKIAVDSAQASLDSAQATVTQTQAAISQSQATVNQNQVNLDHATIEAPIDGIIIQRSVDVGQTVAASMQAPTLFIIAADLTKMQVNANIDEADVGRIRPGQHVTFKVDAYPTDTFEGIVSQIRLQPVVVSNVTTYGTVIDVPNAELKLKPGMTANVKVEIAKRSNVLRVPAAALRFRPTLDMFATLNQAVPPEALATGRGGRGGQGRGNRGDAPDGTTAAPSTSSPTGAGRAAPPAAAGATPGPAAAAAPPAGGGSGAGPEQGRGATATGQGGDGRRGFDPARMMERFKGMSPDEQKQFIARMKDRGQDTSLFENKGQAAAKATAKTPAKGKGAVAAQGAETIDALFAPLPTVESRGRVWLFIDHQLKPVSLRLGITDGSNTELLSGELQQNMEAVTSVTGLSPTRTTTGPGAGNPLMPAGRGGPGGRGR